MEILKDMFRFGPAPTMKRELMSMLVMLVALGVFLYWGVSNDKGVMVYIIGAVLAVYVLGRVVVRAISGNDAQKPKDQGHHHGF